MNMVKRLKIAVLIPTYNEYENIAVLVGQIFDIATRDPMTLFSVFIIDDSSPDGTAALVLDIKKKLILDNFTLTVLIRQRKEGLAKAYIYAFAHIKSSPSPPDYVLQMDADLSHNPKYIPNFVNAVKNYGADFVVGSRYIPGGTIPSEWPIYRKAISILGNYFARRMLQPELTDYTGGFNMYSIELIKVVDFDKIHCSGYGFLIELKLIMLRQKKTLVQIPIAFLDRSRGKSKMPPSTIIDSFILVLKLKLLK
jgi:dolichol-phosphate mannosyltransferase